MGPKLLWVRIWRFFFIRIKIDMRFQSDHGPVVGQIKKYMTYIHNKAGNFQCFCLSENQNLSKSKHFEIVVTFCLEFWVCNSVTFLTNLDPIRQTKVSNCNKKLNSLLDVNFNNSEFKRKIFTWFLDKLWYWKYAKKISHLWQN